MDEEAIAWLTYFLAQGLVIVYETTCAGINAGLWKAIAKEICNLTRNSEYYSA